MAYLSILSAQDRFYRDALTVNRAGKLRPKSRQVSLDLLEFSKYYLLFRRLDADTLIREKQKSVSVGSRPRMPVLCFYHCIL